jgi:hypothetical protein
MDARRKAINKFKGLNNVADPFRLTPDWQVQADNIDITRTQGITRCKGYTRATTNTSLGGAYASIDQARLYVIDNGALKQYDAAMTATTLRTGLSMTQPYAFEEVNGVVFYSNGVDMGTIDPAEGAIPWGVPVPVTAPDLSFTAGALPYGKYSATVTYVDPWGRESGNSDDVATIEGEGQLNFANIPQVGGYTTNVYMTGRDGTVLQLVKEGAGTSFTVNSEGVLGRELQYWNAKPPRGYFMSFFQGRMWIAEWFPQNDYSVLWASLPLQYHHFRFGEDGIVIPGDVRMMEVAHDALIIGTDRQVWAFDGEKLEELAQYGMPSGFHGARVGDDDTVFFWTMRGLCSALPFKNLTEDKFYVAPGTSASAAVVEQDGTRRYLVALRKGGQPYNRR